MDTEKNAPEKEEEERVREPFRGEELLQAQHLMPAKPVLCTHNINKA